MSNIRINEVSPILKRSFSINTSPINKTGYCSHRPRLGRRFDTTKSDLMYTCNTRSINKNSYDRYNGLQGYYDGIRPVDLQYRNLRFTNRSMCIELQLES